MGNVKAIDEVNAELLTPKTFIILKFVDTNFETISAEDTRN